MDYAAENFASFLYVMLLHADFRIINAAYKFLCAVSQLSTSIWGSTCKSILTVLTIISSKVAYVQQNDTKQP